MSRRGENIRKRKDGRWEGRYKNGQYKNGLAQYCSVYGHTYSEVKKKLDAIKENRESQPAVFNDDIRFSDVLKMWEISNKVHVKAATEYKYAYVIERHILPQLGWLRMSEMNSIRINGYLDNKLREGRMSGDGGLSSSYVKTMAIIIGAAIKFAEAEGICMPLKTPIIKPAVAKKEMQILKHNAQKQFEEMMAIIPDKTKLGVFIALHTGMRIGEICALKWQNIDLDEEIIHVRHTISRIKNPEVNGAKTILIVEKPKTVAAVRDIPISSVLLPVLQKMKRNFTSEYVLSGTNSFISTRTFDYRYRRMLKSLGIKHIHFHALRHTFATRCVEAGVDVKTLSEILGHANVSTTLSTYVHPSMEIKRVQLEKLYEASRSVM